MSLFDTKATNWGDDDDEEKKDASKLKADAPSFSFGAPPPAAAAPSGAILLLGVMSGSAARREHLRCTWMRADILRPHVRALFVVGKATAESMPDVLPVDVQARFAIRRAILRRAIL